MFNTQPTNLKVEFQAGKTNQYLCNWKHLTLDIEILQTVSGLPIELTDEVVQTHLHHCSQQHESVTDDEIEKLDHEKGEILSPMFLKKKTNGSFRLILNLRSLNKNIKKQHFKMETITSILKLVTPNMYFTKIDLKDTYDTIPILEEQQKYLTFANKEHLYKFTCLPNGYCHGPRKFTKALQPPLSKICLNKIKIVASLDTAWIWIKGKGHVGKIQKPLLILF